MPDICQKTLPIKPWMQTKTNRLPGLNPIAPGEWLLRDEVFAAQMAYRTTLLAHKRDAVFRATDESHAAQHELLETVLSELDNDYQIAANTVTRPDGVTIALDLAKPLLTIAHLVQEDFLLLQKSGDEHVLTAGVLCFPASWSLAEKFENGLLDIHNPVAEYDANMAKRVQRVFDVMRPETPMWRANYLLYVDADLFQPTRDPRNDVIKNPEDCFVRVERQTLRKLPKTNAVAFSVHTFVVPFATLSKDEAATFLAQKHT